MHKVLVAAVAAVALTTPAISGENARGVTDNEIVIGTYTDLSGVTAVWGVNDVNAYRMAFDEANALVAETLHKPTDTDFSAAVAKLRDADCDVIPLGAIVRDTVQIVSALRKVGWHVDILGNEPIYDQSVADVTGGATEGVSP